MYFINVSWSVCSLLIYFFDSYLVEETCLSEEVLQTIFYTINVVAVTNVIFHLLINYKRARKPIPPSYNEIYLEEKNLNECVEMDDGIGCVRTTDGGIIDDEKKPIIE